MLLENCCVRRSCWVTYIIAERNKSFAGVVGIKSECLVEASLLVGAGVLGGDQLKVWQLQLVKCLLVAHLREQVLKVLGIVIGDLS